MIYGTLALAIVFNASANILIKYGVTQLGAATSAQPLWIKAISNAYLWGGIVSFGLALLFYAYTLYKMDLSVAYPIFVSLGFIIVLAVSVTFLGETLKPIQLLGIVLILVGVWLVASHLTATA